MLKLVTALVGGLLGVVLSFEASAQQAKIVAVYEGQYTCGQGKTALVLHLHERKPTDEYDTVTFEFGPTKENPSVPEGAFLVDGRFSPAGGSMLLAPLQWIKRPRGYHMVALRGASNDGGMNFEGAVASATGGCTAFSVKRRATN